MSKIYGNENVIKMAKDSKPGDRSVYINWDFISELPDQYEVVITEIKFDLNNLNNDFSDVGNGNFMPTPNMMYKIAEACGISGGEKSDSQPIIEEIDINPMLCKPLDANPTIRKMTVGRKVSKYSTRIQEDGSLLRSSVCTSEYNVWERCLEAWSIEEMHSEGYTKQMKYPAKYENMYKRRKHFDSELKFAHAKAETKAHLKTIRELAGLMTGYRKEDLSSGRLIFAKVRKSRQILQAETAAHLAAISQGHQNNESTNLLFGPTEPEQESKIKKEDAVSFDVVEEEKPKKSNREFLIAMLDNYQKEDLIIPEFKESIQAIINWLKGNEDAEKNKTYWTKALNILKQIEQKIPDAGKITHKLY